jgi:transcriptional regulator with XRE-family HTH domain
VLPPSDPRRALGFEVKRVVDASPLLKKQVARKLGVSPALLSNWFAGRVVPSAEHLDALSELAAKLGLADSQLRHIWQRARNVVEDVGGDADSDRAALVDFLGRDVAAHGLTLVYPEFAIRDGQITPKDGVEVHTDLTKFPGIVRGERLNGFGPVVSSFDLRGASLLMDLCAHHGITARLGIDSSVLREDEIVPSVAFGLRTNALTTFYLQSGVAKTMLFTSDQDDHPKVTLPNGVTAESAPPVWRGVVARFTPQPIERPDRKWFFCAGLGGNGTVLAATYLVTFWRDLHRSVGSADFSMIVAGHELTPATMVREAMYVQPRAPVSQAHESQSPSSSKSSSNDADHENSDAPHGSALNGLKYSP